MSEPEFVNEFIKTHYVELTDKEIATRLGLSYKTVKGRRQRMGLYKNVVTDKATGQVEQVGSVIQKMLEERGLPLTEVAVDKIRITNHENEKTATKTRSEVITINLAPDWADGPDWPVVQQAKPTKITPINKKPEARTLKKCLILPDPQIGYRYFPGGVMEPTHDEMAIDVALQIAEAINPDLIINLGDTLDFPQFSTHFVMEPAFAVTVQETLDRAHEFFAQQKASAPNAHIVVLEGNHDRRLQDMIIKNARSAFGLKRAQSPESWPVLSVPFLLRLEDLGVEYAEGYPACEYYINDRLKCVHGRRYGRRGTIAKNIVNDERVSTITGHTHHVESVYKTTHTRQGPKFAMAATLGCLCKIDGTVPSTHSAIDSIGRPVTYYEDWQQCVGIVDYEEGEGSFALDTVLIYEGQAVYNNEFYRSSQ